MSKYQELMERVRSKQHADVIQAKIDKLGKDIQVLRRDLSSAETMHAASLRKVDEFKELLATDPVSNPAKKGLKKWQDFAKTYGDKVTVTHTAIELAEKDRSELIGQARNDDVAELADLAVIEKRTEIDKLYQGYLKAIEKLLKARENCLKAASEMNAIRNQGRHAVEAGQKAQTFAKRENLGYNVCQISHFSSPVKPFLISASDIEKA